MTHRPLLCTRCGDRCAVAEDFTGYADWGVAVIDEEGIVRPALQHVDIYRGEPFRTRAVCQNPECEYQWTLRRRFDPVKL